MRASKVPKGKTFLQGTSAAMLHKKTRAVDSGEDALRYLTIYQRKTGREIVGITRSLGMSAETSRR